MGIHANCNLKMETLTRINNNLSRQLQIAQDIIHQLELLLEDVAYSRIDQAPKVALRAIELLRPGAIRVRKAGTNL